MEFRELSVESRSIRGSNASQRLRREGALPGVVYSGGGEALPIMVDDHTFVQLAKRSAPTQLFKLKSAEKSLDGKLALVKDIQIEPIKERVLHVDFFEVSEGHELVLSVRVELQGEAPAVKIGSAVLQQPVYELEVACVPGNIPSSIVVDVSSLQEGGSIHAGDVELPEGVKLKSSPGVTLVSAVSAKKDIEEEEEAGEAEGEGAAESEGAAPKEGADTEKQS